ncbi:uroporphyrinogen-III synthase [Tropicimonas sp. IMCC6043]|uniref:uroporphyrinogen-III synthase n=1 Tax=Tropicimonas sp. IMCC6043 TaxID=2510645 RepID=UPI00101BE9D5|nr:uroporphyrinogen-III synthase [Tropicimonas sp. IMCC6043]RYH10002.1 uroporphyrinogen-III synthase [Tropicimonas sp. IMCC6043]
MAANVNLGETSLLLTRPSAASERFHAQAEAEIGRFARVVISPLLRIVPLQIDETPKSGEDIVLTSENGVSALEKRDLLGARTWCVGTRTAERARSEGAVVNAVARDGAELAEMIVELSTGKDFVHVAGRHRRGDIVGRLRAAGKRARVIEAYDQVAEPLREEAADLLQNPGDVVAPLFSPRSARLLAEAAGDRVARLHAIAISEAAADRWQGRPGERFLIAPTADAAGVLSAMGSLFDADRPA